jgi:hypothetical protein
MNLAAELRDFATSPVAVLEQESLSLESLAGEHGMAEMAASCSVCSCCIVCCCCCCG